MAPITLIYFRVAGRAEAIRLALVLGGIEFEDKRLTFEEFKSSGFKYLPVMQVCSHSTMITDYVVSKSDGPSDLYCCVLEAVPYGTMLTHHKRGMANAVSEQSWAY